MIRNIKGEYLYYDKGSMIIETSGGIGFRIYVADTSPLLLHREGDIVIYLRTCRSRKMACRFMVSQSLIL